MEPPSLTHEWIRKNMLPISPSIYGLLFHKKKRKLYKSHNLGKRPASSRQASRRAKLRRELNEARSQLEQSRFTLKSIRFFGYIVLLVAPIAALIMHKIVLIIGVAYAMPMLLLPPRSQREWRVQEIQDQIDALDFENEKFELRAERQFKQHQVELKRYYDQTLTQSSWTFMLGIFCILAGFTVLSGCAYFIFKMPSHSISEKIIVAVLGATGSILGNYIAAIYLKMQSNTIQSLTAFHNRLVNTHHLYFGYFLAAKVSPNTAASSPSLREQTLAQMALAVASAPTSEPSPKYEEAKEHPTVKLMVESKNGEAKSSEEAL